MTSKKTTSLAHTPAPWTAATKFDVNGMIVSNDGNVCNVCCMDLANSRLIAAAPELLEACETALNFINSLGLKVDKTYSVSVALVSAMNKAKGK